jgi:hypothetical protein
VLHDPPPIGSPVGTLGPVHDLTGSTAWKLHVKRPDGLVVTRTMTKVGLDTAGTLSYTWLDSDWDVTTGLVVGPTPPLKPSDVEHTMEYEVLGPSTARMTFPNGGWDVLRVVSDIGQG